MTLPRQIHIGCAILRRGCVIFLKITQPLLRSVQPINPPDRLYSAEDSLYCLPPDGSVRWHILPVCNGLQRTVSISEGAISDGAIEYFFMKLIFAF